MSRVLLDVNILIALAWPTHVSHAGAQRWFARNAQRGWATCPITQAAFVRILSNPAFSADALTPKQALAVLDANIQHENHHFWADDLSMPDVFRRAKGNIAGHRQVTDAYLIALAANHRAAFATFDAALKAFASDTTVEVISA